MRKYLTLFALILALTLTGCGASEAHSGKTVACTTYPVYLLAQAVTKDVDGVKPVLVVDQQISCLHNYTLTMKDMKAIEGCDLLAINGADMESFLEDVLEQRPALDCSAGIPLLEPEGEEEHDHESHDHHDHEHDPHIWLDPMRAAQMAQNLADGLSEADPKHSEGYQANAAAIKTELTAFYQAKKDTLSALDCWELITFHDGFAYFADAFDLTIAAAVEEEEGSEASARRVRELVALIDEYQIPAVFAERNGSDSTAVALSYERGTGVYALDLGMSRSKEREGLDGLVAYESILDYNVSTILEAYQ